MGNIRLGFEGQRELGPLKRSGTEYTMYSRMETSDHTVKIEGIDMPQSTQGYVLPPLILKHPSQTQVFSSLHKCDSCRFLSLLSQ